MKVREEPGRIEKILRKLKWGGVALCVAAAGASAGAFVVEWVRTPDNGSLMFQIGDKWLARFCVVAPAGDFLHHHWHHSFLHHLTGHFPGLFLGGCAALFLWIGIAMRAAWENCLLFPEALKRFGGSMLPLLVFPLLAWIEYRNEFLIRQWIAFLPFAVTFFLAGGVFRKIRERALPLHRTNPLGDEIDHRLPLALLALISLHRFSEWWEVASMRHANFHSQAYDLGLMTHTINRFVTGEGLTSSLLESGGSFLGHHFSPILFLLAPFSFFNPHPDTLIFIQSALVAFATVPLYLFARIYLQSNWAAFAVGWMYLHLPGLSEGVYSDFHAICFAPILLFWLAAEAVRGMGPRFWIALILLLAVQENTFIYGLFLGLFFIGHSRHRRIGMWMAGVSLAGGLIVFAVLQPLLRPSTDLGYGFVHRYADFLPDAGPNESGMMDLATGLLTQPGTIFSLLFDETRTRVYKLFWRGPLYLPLVNPAGWLILAPVLENSLSSEVYIHEWGGHYGIGPAALTALAMTAGLGLIGRFVPFRRRFIPISFSLLASTILWGLKKAHLPYSIYLMSFYYATPTEPPTTARALLEELPPRSSTAALSYLVPHLVHQPEIYELPPGQPHSIAEITDPSKPNFDILVPTVGWPDYLVYNPEAPEGAKWHNLWFYDKARTLEWLKWLEESGKYRLFFPKGVRGEKESTLRILERVETPE